MTHPADVTHRLDWADVISALRAQVALIDLLVDRITHTDADPHTQDPHPDRDLDRDLVRDLVRQAETVHCLDHHTRLDHDTDHDLDGDVDPAPELETP